MSVYSSKTSVASILKPFAPVEREKAKTAALNKVRFTMPKQKGLLLAVETACETENFQQVNEYIAFLRESELSDAEFLAAMVDARKVANELSPKFTHLVETLLSLSWTNRSVEAVTAYTEFFIDIMVAHSKYIHFGILKLIALWIPPDNAESLWANGTPVEQLQQELNTLHKLLDRILTAVPLSFDVVLEAIETKYPYFKKPTHVIAGYLHNVLWLMEYKPIFTEVLLQLVLQKMLILDVNAPRDEIEVTDDDDDDVEQMETEPMFEMDDIPMKTMATNEIYMKHPIAQTLDICMFKLFQFLQTKNPNRCNLNDEQKFNQQLQANKFIKQLICAFDEVILPSHNTHHLQFLLFYFSSFKPSFADMFLGTLWHKIQNPNTSAVIRQAAVGYLSSFLARAKFLNINVIKHYLREFSNWAHNYIQRCDQYRFNGSLKANLVFYTVCQAIFYVIAFRSRDLTSNKKSLIFLQSLQLSALVTCNFNPLRVCLPAVATSFAGVTRTYQLAYCHAILERNARRKLATVYANETATAEETLDTLFPFDPYLLKLSNREIESIYLKYQATEAEEHAPAVNVLAMQYLRRKRCESDMQDDVDNDDFLLPDKRQKFNDLAKSSEREAQFNYGLSPGFHF